MHEWVKIWSYNIMKKLIVVRHSKSSWKDSNLSDCDRPLNKRGNRDGKKMSEFLSKYINL